MECRAKRFLQSWPVLSDGLEELQRTGNRFRTHKERESNRSRKLLSARQHSWSVPKQRQKDKLNITEGVDFVSTEARIERNVFAIHK